MAIASINIPITGKMGYVDAYYPNTVFPVTADGVYSVTSYGWDYESGGVLHHAKYDRYLFLEFGDFPAALKYNRIYDFQLTIAYFRHNRTQTSSARGDVGNLSSICAGDFDPNTLTYNTRPRNLGAGTSWYVNTGKATEHPDDVWLDGISGLYGEPRTSSPASSSVAVNALKRKILYLYDNGERSFDSKERGGRGSYDDWIDVKPRLMNGNLPYVTITYDDEEIIPGEIVFIDKLEGEVDQGVAHTITWEVGKDTTVDWACMAESWEQTSATIYWREQGTSVWNEIQIPGDTKEYTFPARTFGSNKTYEYYASANDISGGSSETATFTFTTPGSQLTPQSSPVSGYVNPREATSFGWSYATDSGSVAAGSTVLHWREQGASSWTDVQAASGANSLTIAANTFSPLKVYEWYLSGEDTYGYASSTTVYSFSTSAAQITSNPVSPINSIENKNEAITFEWDFASQDSAPASACTLQYKHTSDSSWTTIQSFNTGGKTYDVPASTFDAGAIEWRVIPYNIDGVEGTATVASFISYGAPVAPTVYTNGAPFLTINWQAEEQESYQIMVDDESFGPYFGTEKSFILPDFLSDGSHSVKVRVMGVYGLWSKWGNTDVTIENQPGSDMILTYVSGIDCLLSWETVATESDFRVYRDGKQIGKTDKNEFSDRFVLGEHTYKVIDRLDDGNYSVSNEVTVTMVVAETMIAALNGGEWLPITYSLKDSSDPQFEESVETVYSHFYGNVFPSAFISGYQESTMSFSAVFFYNQAEEEAKFLSLFGKPVILKFKSGAVFIGILDNWSRQARKEYWTGYTFTLRRVDWGDFVDDTQ